MEHLLPPMVLVLAFVGVTLLAQTLLGLAFTARDSAHRVNRRLTMMAKGVPQAEIYAKLVRHPKTSWVSRSQFAALHDRAALFCRQAGLTVGPLRIVGMAAAAAGGLWLLSMIFLRASPVSTPFSQTLMAAFGAASLSAAVAAIWIAQRRASRLCKLEDQLPLSLDIMVRALKAGHPVVSAVNLVTQEMPDPIGTEFGIVMDETTYGGEFKDALRSLATRTGSKDIAFFSVSVAIQAETGGNLAEILGSLAAVIRGRATLSKRIRSLSSEGRMSAMILSLLPIICVSIVSAFNPEFYTNKFSDPAFWPIVGCILFLYLLGQLMIRRIVKFKY
jgi:tight adherence protein B